MFIKLYFRIFVENNNEIIERVHLCRPVVLFPSFDQDYSTFHENEHLNRILEVFEVVGKELGLIKQMICNLFFFFGLILKRYYEKSTIISVNFLLNVIF